MAKPKTTTAHGPSVRDYEKLTAFLDEKLQMGGMRDPHFLMGALDAHFQYQARVEQQWSDAYVHVVELLRAVLPEPTALCKFCVPANTTDVHSETCPYILARAVLADTTSE